MKKMIFVLKEEGSVQNEQKKEISIEEM